MKETKASQILNAEERGKNIIANAVGFFRGGGGRTDRDVGSLGLLDGQRSKLRTVLVEDFLETCEGLDFFEQGGITARKFQKLDSKSVTVRADTSIKSCGGA
jgi:hypothetical protein